MTTEKNNPLNEENWEKDLTPEQYYVCRKKGTEPPFYNKYYLHEEQGTYYCVCCKNALFDSEDKYDSKSGWPSFTQPINKENIITTMDETARLEVLCSKCQSHLGHVFPDGPHPKGLRYCINSIALDFKKKHD